MRVKRNISYYLIVGIAMLTITFNVSAQQDPIYTQYIENLQVVNPGFAGSADNGRLLLASRNQWVSIKGAPVTRSISFAQPLNQNVGIGFSLLHDKIGPLKQTGIYLDYAYFLRINNNFRIGLGVKGGVTFYRADFTSLETVDPDPIYSRDIFKKFLPNMGVGLFAHSDKTYFGVSIPKLIENTVSRTDYQTNYVNKEKIHVYTVAGTKLDVNQGFQIKINGMFQFVKNTPISLQSSLMGGFNEKIWVGGMLRFGDAFGLVAQFQLTSNMLIGYSYDITTSELNAFSNGTHEIMFRYNLNIF